MKTTLEELELIATLRPREKQICALLALGYGLAPSAKKLGIAYNTAHVYRMRAIGRLKCGSTLKTALFIARRPEIEKLMRESLEKLS